MAADTSGQAVASSRSPRKRRPTRVGLVTSDKRDKTIAVTVMRLVEHPKYGKYVGRRSVLHAHDENNEAAAGDKVEIAMTRRMSKTKSWRLTRILERAPRGGSA